MWFFTKNRLFFIWLIVWVSLWEFLDILLIYLGGHNHNQVVLFFVFCIGLLIHILRNLVE